MHPAGPLVSIHLHLRGNTCPCEWHTCVDFVLLIEQRIGGIRKRWVWNMCEIYNIRCDIKPNKNVNVTSDNFLHTMPLSWWCCWLFAHFPITIVHLQTFVDQSKDTKIQKFKIWVFSATFWHEITLYAIDIDKKRFRTPFLTL